MWYRFYNLTDNQHFMAGRDSVKVFNITDLSEEMKTGYWWAGNWGTPLIHATMDIPLEERT